MTKIISEIGVNWGGNLETAKDMILKSKCAGADFVKFQMFNEETIKDSKYKDELSSMILDYSKLTELRKYAYQQNIGFGVSTMYPEAFEQITGIFVDFIKIRCQDSQNEKIAKPAVRFCDKWNIPLLVSTERPISDYYKYTIYSRSTKYLYCIPKYPPELNEISNKYISTDYFDGYSNHYLSKYLPMLAVAKELDYVEIHVKRAATQTNSLYDPGLQIDENVSIDFDDLKEICDFRDILLKLPTR